MNYAPKYSEFRTTFASPAIVAAAGAGGIHTIVGSIGETTLHSEIALLHALPVVCDSPQQVNVLSNHSTLIESLAK